LEALAAAALIVAVLLLDLTILSANLLKVVRGRLGFRPALGRPLLGDLLFR